MKEATSALTMLLRNVVASCICAWIANFLYNLGNPFAFTSSHNQSTATLILANLIWTNIIFCSIMVLTHTTILLPLRFLTDPDKPPTLWFCIKQLVRASYAYYVMTIALQVCLGLLVGRVFSSSVHKFKLDFYLGTLVNHVYTTGIDIATRVVFRTKTCQGKEWIKRRAQEQQQQPPRQARKPRRFARVLLYWKAYAKGSSKLIPTFLAGAYVHIVSQTHIFRHGLKTFVFVVVSTAAKLIVQEMVKHHVVKHQVKDIRTMCVLVGLPTVLIDTQVRIVLLCQQSNTFAAAGMLAMAVVEITLRGGKAALLSVDLRRRHSAILRRSTATLVQLQIAQDATRAAAMTSKVNNAPLPDDTQLAAVHLEFENLRRLMHRFHAAEANADMHAEYIAIGCSASIWFFYSKHPRYDLGQSAAADSDSFSTLAPLLLIQVGMEIVVDYISCMLEIAAGVDFKSMRRFGFFLAMIFMTNAVLNIAISALLYLG